MMNTPVMARTNGRAKEADILKLGDTTEERRPVEINGRVLSAWVVTNGRYPTSVAAELDDARNRWLAARVPVDPNAAIPSTLWDVVEQLADVVEEGADDQEAVLAASQAVARVVRSLQEDPEMRSTEVEWQLYLTRALCALIPGLEQYEAEMLRPETRILAVTALGYLRSPTQQQDEDEEEAEEEGEPGGEPQSPPEVGPSSTGVEPAPGSAGSTV